MRMLWDKAFLVEPSGEKTEITRFSVCAEELLRTSFAELREECFRRHIEAVLEPSIFDRIRAAPVGSAFKVRMGKYSPGP